MNRSRLPGQALFGQRMIDASPQHSCPACFIAEIDSKTERYSDARLASTAATGRA
jgi:hypothetical protein